jgi:hypothetical protein
MVASKVLFSGCRTPCFTAPNRKLAHPRSRQEQQAAEVKMSKEYIHTRRGNHVVCARCNRMLHSSSGTISRHPLVGLLYLLFGVLWELWGK